jgi:dTDP-4-dehydrorhamnose reductase
MGLGHAELDVTDREAVRGAVVKASPDWVVHCAAYTAVDRAESEPDLAMRVNRDGAEHVARAAAEAGARLLHVSTDYVFDGEKRTPYLPNDDPAPLSAYGRSKLEGERAVMRTAPGGRQPLVVRTGWMYGAGGRNFVEAMVERARRGEPLRIVDDQTGRPTWARNVAEVALDLMERGVEGVWHVADSDTATWLELAHEALGRAGVQTEVVGVGSDAFGAAARRPSWSVLDLEETEALLGRTMEPWREALGRFLNEEVET